jgi:AMP nucleosidase
MPNGDSTTLDQSKIDDARSFTDSAAAVERIRELYDEAVSGLRADFDRFARGEDRGDDGAETEHRYPHVSFEIGPRDVGQDRNRAHAYGHFESSGLHGTTVTRPDIFGDYLAEQIGLAIAAHGRPVVVGRSRVPIPLPYAAETADAGLSHSDMAALKARFPFPDLSRIEDRVPNGTYMPKRGKQKPLSLFSAQRVDFSLMRLKHYTGTSPEHFQNYVLFTNYQRYIDAFVETSEQLLRDPSGRFLKLIGPGDIVLADADGPKSAGRKMPQMPAWHLVAKNGKDGITIVNIGVGPSNAKTLTDHLAVLRPHAWIMLGHAGGLRDAQRIGDYALAHAYVRADHVLDADLPVWVPVPPIAEIQTALAEATGKIAGLGKDEVKRILRTGTVFTTDDRDWELRRDELAVLFNQSRAIAVDMESATIAANGYRFRVPYGTLLCISDKPLHHEPKMPGMANSFYDAQVGRHLLIGIETMERLRANGAERLHSRKLRSFDEPAFR